MPPIAPPRTARLALRRAEGFHVWDAEGRRYLDAISGAFCVQLGYSRTDLARAMAEAAARLPFARASTADSQQSAAYARELLEAAGPPYTRAVFTSSGSEAVEAAVKAAYRYQAAMGRPERARIAHIRGHFHGATLGALGVTGLAARTAPYEELLRRPRPDPVGAAEKGERAPIAGDTGALNAEDTAGLIADDTAALIAETIPAVGLGAPLPAPGHLKRRREACDAGGALWIADEVLTGFGRTGALFAWRRLAERAEDLGATPDIVVFGKGAGAGYAPLGGVLLAERVARVLSDDPAGPFAHAQTYGGNPIACAVGRRVLAALREEEIERRVRSNERALTRSLAAASEEAGALAPRGLGFLWGIELVRDRASREPYPRELRIAERLEAACRERGVLVFAGAGCADGKRGDHLLIAPPLTAGPELFEEVATAISGAIEDVLSDPRSPRCR